MGTPVRFGGFLTGTVFAVSECGIGVTLSKGVREMKVCQVIGILVFVVLNATPALGGVVPGRWEKLESLPQGTELEVRLHSKERLEGRLLTVEAEELVLDRKEGDELRLPKSQIAKVTSRDRIDRDSTKDGLLWGTLVGAAVGLPWLIWGLSYEGGESDDARAIGTGICLMSVGIGAGVGFAADMARKGHKVYYVAAGN